MYVYMCVLQLSFILCQK